MGPFRGYPCRANVQELDCRIYYVHNAAKIMIVIGSLGIIISFILIGSSTNDLTEVAAEDIYWDDWIVYQGENDAIYLDESIGYTVYVDNSNDCSVSVSAVFQGSEHYESYCESSYDFDNWMQLGDIYTSGSGYYDIEVDADEFVLVDWTTPQAPLEDALIGSFIGISGCCLSLIILIISIILSMTLKEKTPSIINHNQLSDPSNNVKNEEIIQDKSPQENDSSWWQEE